MILYSRWLKLPIATRQTIALAFGIPKKNSTHVVDNSVRDDGYLVGDIDTALTVEALQKYLNRTESDPAVLWDLLLAKTEGRDLSPEIPVVPETKAELPVAAPVEEAPTPKPARGRTRKI